MSYVIHARKPGKLLTYKAEHPAEALHKLRALRAVSLQVQVFEIVTGEEVLEHELEELANG